MSPISQLIAIAEHIDPAQYPPGTGVDHKGEAIWLIKGDYNKVTPITCPNYLKDLNQVNKVEMYLTDKEYHMFTLMLSDIAWREHPHQTDDKEYKNRLRKSFSANADHRCEALLRVWGKWK